MTDTSHMEAHREPPHVQNVNSTPDPCKLSSPAAVRAAPTPRGGEVVCIHSLRVTFATLLADAAVPVKAAQELMQHSSVELTLGLYAKARDNSKQAAVDGLRLLERGKSKPRMGRRKAATS